MSEVKFLGMCITENLSWQAHIHSLCHSLSKTCYIMKSLKNILSIRMLWNIYLAHFQSQRRYGIILWGGTKESINILHIQKKVIRLITSFKKRESCRQKFKENRILTVTSLYVVEVLCFIKRYKGTLKHNFVIHECNTRSKYDLHTQFCNTSLFQKSVINVGVKLYKYLPSKIKKLENSSRFRKEVKLALLSNSFYMRRDFIRQVSAIMLLTDICNWRCLCFPFDKPHVEKVTERMLIYVYNTVIISYMTLYLSVLYYCIALYAVRY
jgi:hypothetical protein